MKYLPVLMTLFLFSNCDSTRQTQYNNPNASFETILESVYGGKDEKSYTIIRSNSELKSEMAQLHLEETTMNRMNAVDFKNQLVLSLHMGTRNTGGFSIGVSNVEINGNTTYVTIKETGPAPGENVTMALTQPFAIVVIDANETIIFN
jgi:hypothetical protein